MHKIAIIFGLGIILLFILRGGLSYWYFDQGVQEFNKMKASVSQISREGVISSLQAAKHQLSMSYLIKPTIAADTNRDYILKLLQNLQKEEIAPDQKTENTPQSNTPSGNQENEEDSSNTGPQSIDKKKPDSQSTEQETGTEGSKGANPNLKSRIDELKELQQNKGDFTRPNGTQGVAPERSLMEQFFGSDPFFGESSETRDY